MGATNDIEKLSENLATICERVETCAVKNEVLAIFLIGISPSEGANIVFFVDEYYNNEDYTWITDEFYDDNFKSTSITTTLFNERKMMKND